MALIGAFLLLFSAEYEGAATVFNLVFGIGYVPAVLITAAVIAVYALLGGFFLIRRATTCCRWRCSWSAMSWWPCTGW